MLVENGRIADIGPRLFNDAEPRDPEIIDCHGLVLAPGLIDCRVFTGEPGSEHRESLESASEAAAAGGVTTIVTMPNTNPVIDEPSLVDFIRRRAQATAKVRVAPMAALTQRLAGEIMTEIGLLKEAGAVAFTDGDRTVANARVMRRALSYAATFDALVVGHAEDPELVRGRRDHRKRIRHPAGPARGAGAGRSHHRGTRHPPGRADRRALPFRTDLDPRRAGRHRRRQARGLPITCGVSAHHLLLNELDVGAYYTFRKVKPPLRSEADRAAMVEGVANGIIDVIVSSHEPQGADTKRQTFAAAAFGAVGLETLLPAALGLHHDGHATLSQILAALTATPARLLGLPAGTLAKGAPADLVLLDTDEPFVVDERALHSRARNTAFEGRKFQGRAQMTFVGGECVFSRAIARRHNIRPIDLRRKVPYRRGP